MAINGAHAISRRHFLTTACLAAAWTGPYRLFAQHEGDQLVNRIRGEADSADITVQPLRGNVSAKIATALAGISSDPIKQLINTHWHFDHTDGNEWLAERNIAKVTATTVAIPGHGPVGDRSTLIEFRDMLVTIRAKVAALKKQGQPLDAVLAAKPTAAFDAKWGTLIPPSLFTRLVYVGV